MHDELLRLTRELRNHRNSETNWPAFQNFMHSNLDEVVSTYTVRWLRSICDTYADYAEPAQARNGMLISMFVSMLVLAETTRFVRPKIDAARYRQTFEGKVGLWEGYSTFAINNQDRFLHVSRRLDRFLADDKVMHRIWHRILEQVKAEDTVLSDYARVSKSPERYFPADPTGIKDNYGV